MVDRCHVGGPALLALELLVEVEDGALLLAVVHVAHPAPAGGVVGSRVCLGGVAGALVVVGIGGGSDGGGGDGVVVDGDGGQVAAVAVGGVGVALGGDGGGGAVAGAAAAEGHRLDVVVVGEGFVEGVAGGHFCWWCGWSEGLLWGLWMSLFSRRW